MAGGWWGKVGKETAECVQIIFSVFEKIIMNI